MPYPRLPERHPWRPAADDAQEQFVVWGRSDGAAGILAFRDPGAVRRSLEVVEDRVLSVLWRTDDFAEAAKVLAAALTVTR